MDLYKKFYTELKKDYKLTKKDITTWTYAGYFSHTCAISKGIHKLQDDKLGERHFDSVMKNNVYDDSISDFYEFATTECVCKVEIQWNHIIIKDINSDTLEYGADYLILGSECIDKFGNICIDRKCSMCDIKINNSISGKCKDCKKIRVCPDCDEPLLKGKSICRNPKPPCNYSKYKSTINFYTYSY